jgi:hypothetical protein
MSEGKRFNGVSGYYGDVVGDVTGNVTGNLTGNVTGDVTGDVTGNVTGDLTGTADNATNANSATYATQVDIADDSLTVSVTPNAGTFTISGTQAHSFNIVGIGATRTLKLVTIHFVCSGASGANFPLVIDFGGDPAIEYTEVFCNVTTTNTARTLSGVIAANASDITIQDSNGLNPAANQNWSVYFFYTT